MIKKFGEHVNESNLDNTTEIKALELAKGIMDSYQNSPAWVNIIRDLNNDDVEYSGWSDIDVLIYWLQNYNI